MGRGLDYAFGDAWLNVLLWGGIIIAIVVPLLSPVVGLVIGVIGLLLAIRARRSFILPIVTLAFSIGFGIFYWVKGISPLGLLGAFIG